MTLSKGDLWRRAWAILALVTALVFAFEAGPGHGEDFALGGDHPAAVADHHPGDADGGIDGHAGGAHCAGHCSGHSVTGPASAAPAAWAAPREIAYGLAPGARLDSLDREPLTRPPAA